MPYVPGFSPSRSAQLFHNGPWPPGLDLTVSVAGLPPVSIDVTRMGLCGGMSFLARDIYESGTPQLRGVDSRIIPLQLGRHLLGRLIDSFLGPGVIAHWLRVTAELDHGTWFCGPGLYAETVAAARTVMATIDAGVLTPIGVVLTQSLRPWDVFSNHVELVYGYDLVGTQLTLHVYDSNVEGSDNVTISLDIGSTEPAKPVISNGTAISGQGGRIRGFFVLPFEYRDPSPAYVDDGSVGLTTPPPATMVPGQTAVVSASIENSGSTTFDPALGYRLGTQSPQDNASWGSARFELPGPLDPGRVATHTVLVTAPPSGSPDFALRLVHEPGRFFGRPSAVASVTVEEPAEEHAEEHVPEPVA